MTRPRDIKSRAEALYSYNIQIGGKKSGGKKTGVKSRFTYYDYQCKCLKKDWNTVLNNDLDKLGGAQNHANHKSQEFINNIVSDYGLSDIFRLTHGSDRVYTNFNKTYGTASRLDFFLVDDNLVNFPVCSADASHGYKSDHSYISLNIQGSSITPGKGYWKLNNSNSYSTILKTISELLLTIQ